MEDSIKFVTSWLKDTSSHTTDILTILGMGGMGKTSLAKYVYALHSHEFDTSSFVEGISRKCDEKSNGMLDVLKQLCDDISKPSSVQVLDDSIYTSMIENAAARKKVFLVLDDISTLNQLDVLLGRKGFNPGSKILITTKDAWLTKSCTLFKMNVKPNHATYELKVLNEIDSQKLLCYHAFLCNYPMLGYEKVSKKLVKYCKGHPMALKVLGRSLHNRDVTYWQGYLDRIKKENESPVNNVLRMSFDSLSSENDKDLFKHIACIFVGMDKNDTITILEACDIETKTGITNLIDKCLLSIGYNNELKMHELVQEMGRFVVREESPYKPWERSRIWGHESFRVLQQKKGTENVLGLTLDMRMLEKEKLHGSRELKTDALNKMDRLMLLQLNYVQSTGSYNKFPEELRWLCMHGFPLKSVPSELPMENLVVLDMSYSNIESFRICYSYPQRLHKRLKQSFGSCSEDKRLLGSLKILNLSFCEQLRSLGGFDHLPKVERLILKGCIGLLEVCESIDQCPELVLIDLSYCKKLEKLPRSLGMLKKVKTILLKGCNLGESQINVRHKKSSEKIKAMPSDSKFVVPTLVKLSLAYNNLSTESFPLNFNCFPMLRELYLDGNPIHSMPSCVRTISRLEILSMENCNMLMSIENPPHTLKYLNLFFDSTYKPLLRKVVFDPKMSTLKLSLGWRILARSSFEFEGIVKIQPMAGVEEKVLCNLGWTNLDFLNERHLTTSVDYGESDESEIQMYYEFGIFSTIYWGNEIPNWITDRNMGPSISFIIPASPNRFRFRGLNFCCLLTSPFLDERLGFVVDELLAVPVIKISNITRNLTWIYEHYIERVKVGGKSLTLLSHWMFGMNEMECGDHVTVTVRENSDDIAIAVTKECGISFVYDDRNMDEEEDALGYYKSWNHIIGGDLTPFQSTTGEYILNKLQILLPHIDMDLQKYVWRRRPL